MNIALLPVGTCVKSVYDSDYAFVGRILENYQFFGKCGYVIECVGINRNFRTTWTIDHDEVIEIDEMTYHLLQY